MLLNALIIKLVKLLQLSKLIDFWTVTTFISSIRKYVCLSRPIQLSEKNKVVTFYKSRIRGTPESANYQQHCISPVMLININKN